MRTLRIFYFAAIAALSVVATSTIARPKTPLLASVATAPSASSPSTTSIYCTPYTASVPVPYTLTYDGHTHINCTATILCSGDQLGCQLYFTLNYVTDYETGEVIVSDITRNAEPMLNCNPSHQQTAVSFNIGTILPPGGYEAEFTAYNYADHSVVGGFGTNFTVDPH